MLQKEEQASEKHVREILTLMSSSRSYIHACMSAVSKRLVHHLLNDSDPVFENKISYATCRSLEPIGFSISSPYQNSSS
ncbi:hypothetical protein D8674_011490 [Pyrus ussuriensis x Pyrus communis]|uniref:Uncharacterized protein n=1 Tax=Pyrus ussuriensis x Pyrus communis TaxID=2448454 RepID=A0A5N5G4H1_9ROSA|nr:hypothetical protein D8674_011490 [Pyrus ussuriensis x Pyrus communis]